MLVRRVFDRDKRGGALKSLAAAYGTKKKKKKKKKEKERNDT